MCFFFFKQKTAYEMRISDWSSDVCSSDLRWATGGLDVRPENTHPFFDDDFAFAHNGHVSPISELEELLSPASRAALVGDTDSERYFRFVRQSIEEHGDEAEGVSQALATLIKKFPESSLNALMLTPESMFAIHLNSRDRKSTRLNSSHYCA